MDKEEVEGEGEAVEAEEKTLKTTKPPEKTRGHHPYHLVVQSGEVADHHHRLHLETATTMRMKTKKKTTGMAIGMNGMTRQKRFNPLRSSS